MSAENKARQMHAMMLGQLLGHDVRLVEKHRIFRSNFLLMAEREEFVGLQHASAVGTETFIPLILLIERRPTLKDISQMDHVTMR